MIINPFIIDGRTFMGFLDPSAIQYDFTLGLSDPATGVISDITETEFKHTGSTSIITSGGIAFVSEMNSGKHVVGRVYRDRPSSSGGGLQTLGVFVDDQEGNSDRIFISAILGTTATIYASRQKTVSDVVTITSSQIILSDQAISSGYYADLFIKEESDGDFTIGYNDVDGGASILASSMTVGGTPIGIVALVGDRWVTMGDYVLSATPAHESTLELVATSLALQAQAEISSLDNIIAL